MILPNTHNFVDVLFYNPKNIGQVNLLINNVVLITAYSLQNKVYRSEYISGQILKTNETNNAVIGTDLIITLSNNIANYNVDFPESTEL